MLTWSDEFATGSTLVDTQHRMLITRINDLEKMLAGPPPAKRDCDLMLDFLGTYVTSHFKFEEGCMARANCPAHEKNKAAHASFLDVYSKFRARYLVEGPKPQLLTELQKVASDWIKDHILTVDIQLRNCPKS